MFRPQNNLDDLKRRAHAAPTAGLQPKSQLGESTMQPKHFKFKSCAGPVASTANTTSPAEAKPAHCATSRTTSQPSEPSLRSGALSNTTMIQGTTISPSPSLLTVPVKRLSSENFVTSLEASKRAKFERIPEKSDIVMLNTAADTWIKHEIPKAHPALPAPVDPPILSSSIAPADRPISPALLAEYEKHTLTNLNMMLANNISTRLDVVDKLLRVVSGQEPGLDRAMLQESSDNLSRRITAIRTIKHNLEFDVISHTRSTNTPSTPLGAPITVTQEQMPPFSLIRDTTPFTEQHSVASDSTVLTSFIHGTNEVIKPSSSEERIEAITDRMMEIEDDEDAMWAQLDNVSTDGVDVPVSYLSSNPLQPIGNILDRHQSPGKRQTFKSAESSSQDANLVDQTKTPYYPEILRILRNVFNLDSFRPNQLEVINATMSGKDVFVLMPTGGGKSLCYQVPAVCEGGRTKGVSVVVSPLIALMIDQVHHLELLGVDAVLFNSDQGQERSREARARLTNKGRKPKLLYVTPEKLHKSSDMRSILAKLYREGELARFVVDEAHCVSTWGRDFRDAYQDLDRLRQEYPNTPIMALTATANEQVMNDVIDRLGIQKCVLLTQSFNRPNLHYEVRQKKRNIITDINTFIHKHHRGQTGIIYCLSRNKCEEVAKELREKYNLKAKHYHAQMSVDDKHRSQTAWQNGECDIIVATIAFGMGIDKADVRFIIHHSLPMSLDGYYQETGRAGRDGKPATCVLFYSYGDTKILFKLIQDGEKTPEEKKRQEDGVRSVVQYCQNEIDCRRVQVLGYFGQVFDRRDCQKRCDNCLENTAFVEEDMSGVATQAILLVQDLVKREKNVTKLHCLDIFRGANIKAIRDKGHDRLSLFGAGANLSREQGERLFDHLLSLEGFHQVSVANKSGWNSLYIQLGPTANDFLTGKRRLKMMAKVNKPSDKNLKKTTTKPDLSTKPSRRKSGTVVSINKSHSADIFGDDTEDDDADTTLPKNVIDPDDIYDFGSSPPRLATLHPQKGGRHKEPGRMRRKELPKITEDSDESQQCYRELLVVRDKIAHERGLRPEQVIEDSVLQIISAILPTDLASFKEILNENLSNTQVDEMWNVCGRRILEVCAHYKMSSTMHNSRTTQKFVVTELHARYDFHGSTHSNNPGPLSGCHTISRAKTVTKGSSKGCSIRAMPS